MRNPQEAREKVLALKNNGFGVIELCGAFGRDFAKELIELTKSEVAIGYSVNESEQDELFEQFLKRIFLANDLTGADSRERLLPFWLFIFE